MVKAAAAAELEDALPPRAAVAREELPEARAPERVADAELPAAARAPVPWQEHWSQEARELEAWQHF